MAKVGQIVYNLQDYQQSGGKICTSGVNVFQTVVDTGEPGQKISKIDIYSDVVNYYDSKRFTKLGIQAPPGTQFVVNGTKGMIVGRNGIYELDEDIVITELYFIRPKRYELNERKTKDYLDEGSRDLRAAENIRSQALDNLDQTYLNLNDFANDMVNKATLSPDNQSYIYPMEVYDDWSTVPMYQSIFASKQDISATEFSLDKDDVDNKLNSLNRAYWEQYTNIQNTYQASYDAAYKIFTLGLNGVYDDLGDDDLNNVIIDFLY